MLGTQRRRTWAVTLAAAVFASMGLLATHSDAEASTIEAPGDALVKHTEAYGTVLVSTSRVRGNGQLSDTVFTVTNHVVAKYADQDTDGEPQEYLLVWAGDANATDTLVPDVETLPGPPRGWHGPGVLQAPVDNARDGLVGPDFLAVIDVTKGSPSYGKLVNTATVGPLVYNEPHHMQYDWDRGEPVYAGGLFSSMTYSFDVSALPKIRLNGVSLPTNTMGGSVPDAYWVLSDGTAYATYMGGPVLPGPYRYSDGSVRWGNGFAGSPGMVVHFDRNANVLSQSPAATPQGGDPKVCEDLVALGDQTCANPHGIQVREDLDIMVTGDYVVPRTVILDPLDPPSPYMFRPTVRIWDISDRNHPEVTSVSYLPVDPQQAPENPRWRDSSAVMEVAVTHQPGHRGAFAQTMQGGAIYYTPDVTAPNPQWTKVWDDGAALDEFNPHYTGSNGAGTNGGWIWVSQNDQLLFHTIMGRHRGRLGPSDPGAPGGVIALDISQLVNENDPECNLHTSPQGQPKAGDCPTLAGAVGINPMMPGMGPHFGTADNWALGPNGKYHQTGQPKRLAVTDYFLARAGHLGDHKVWMITVGEDGKLSIDKDFNDTFVPQPGWDFNRDVWPHGPFGNAKPHLGLFIVADQDVQ